MAASQTSSIYSDTFELDDLLCRISKQADDQNETTIRALYQERDFLQKNINVLQQSCRAAYKIINYLRQLVAQLEQLLDDASSLMAKEKNDYLANCTAF
ncbi:uncharacterized protein CTRU02_215511 [Colletotrichum truncatum]|uniref:Uncharacterized protein n=1 Tax=Colletotrichum truncatum TaxID=5467 RepID=A0ACC3YCT5_COLTU|nr:uncharacterized protein CTRU02_05544 [Colletotrichum truncatum]KAF6793987.1 hypothetical protein CTRU02_05544 [Colletotrichum truncatum]